MKKLNPIQRLLCASTVLISAVAANAQSVTVLLTNSTLVTPVPGAPPTSTFVSAFLSDDGESARVNVSAVPGVEQPWIYRNGAMSQYALRESPGAFGPNRQGSEANHVFLSLSSERDLANGQIAFFGAAGPSNTPSNQVPVALWRNSINGPNAGQNVEIARLGVDNALGPGIGPQWRFGSLGTNYYNLNQTIDGNVVIDTVLLAPTNAQRSGIVMHRPGQGNSACAVENETGNLGPNISDPNAVFGGAIQTFDPTISGQRVYLTATAFGTSNNEGIWQICNGAPRVVALTRRSDNLGPGTSLTGTFDTIRGLAKPFGTSSLIFTGNYRATSQSGLLDGLFVNNGSSNQLIATESTSGALGPNYQTAVFDSLSTAGFSGAGDTIAFRTSVRVNNVSQTGLFRIRAGGAIEPLAITNQSGSVAPPTGTYSFINRWAVFGNGDVIADCTVVNGISGLYRFAPGKPPQLLLRVGQTMLVPTPQGLTNATLSSYSLASNAVGGLAAGSSAGYDSWAGRNGNILLFASFVINGSTVSTLSLLKASDQDLLFRDGFE